jgi:peptide/nickel transport system permease protein
MGAYILRRVLQMIPVLLIISFLLFNMVFALGDPISRLTAGNPRVTEQDIARIKKLYGLDKRLHERYITWVGNVARGNLGESIVTRENVGSLLASRTKNTLILMTSGFVLTMLIAIPIGLLSALRQYSKFDYVVTTLSFLFYSLPVFFLAFILIYIFSVKFFQWGLPSLPVGGMYDIRNPGGLPDLAKHLVLPSLTLALISSALYIRYLRSSVLEVLGQDYMRTARAKGLREAVVVRRHLLKNASLPLVTLILLQIAAFFSGAVVTETIFSWPGMGRLFIESARNVDYPVLMGILVVASTLVLLFNLIADIAYAYLDPRIKYS